MLSWQYCFNFIKFSQSFSYVQVQSFHHQIIKMYSSFTVGAVSVLLIL